METVSYDLGGEVDRFCRDRTLSNVEKLEVLNGLQDRIKFLINSLATKYIPPIACNRCCGFGDNHEFECDAGRADTGREET